MLVLAGAAFFTHQQWLPAVEHLFSGLHSSASTSQQRPCPPGVARVIPDGTHSTLVAAYVTRDYRITLCANSRGRIYYHSVDLRNPRLHLTVRARPKDGAYIARHDGYVYRVTKHRLIVTRHGKRLLDQTLHPRH